MLEVMVIEDDQAVRRELRILLERNGYKVRITEKFENVVGQIRTEIPDLILLDVNLPKTDGYTICTQIRCFSNVPIIFLTGRSSELDELSGITFGGDDFIMKPFNASILLARMSRVMSRVQKDEASMDVVYKNVSLNPLTGMLVYQGQAVELTKTECKIIYFLFINGGELMLRDKLMDYLWDQSIFVDDNALSVNMSRIREKLKGLGLDDFIKTKRGRGYMI